mgnify:FL=1
MEDLLYELLDDVAVSGLDPLVVILDGLHDFEAKLLVEADRLLVTCLHVQVDIVHVPPLRCLNGKFEQLAACTIDFTINTIVATMRVALLRALRMKVSHTSTLLFANATITNWAYLFASAGRALTRRGS